MNEEDMKGFIESYTGEKMNKKEYVQYKTEKEWLDAVLDGVMNQSPTEDIYTDIYEEVMESGMDNATYPRMYALVKWDKVENLSDQPMHETYIFAVRDNEIPEVFRNGEFSVMSFMDIDHARGFYVRLCKTGYHEVTDPSGLADMKKVYKHYQDQRKGHNSDYALNA
tara:strand:+ start:95 stop:595 length:501 start_codon:yes stop_codon:yes gene_type:complete